MGMYPAYQEVPALSLTKLFLEPQNPDYVDSIIYGEEGNNKQYDALIVPDCRFFKLTENEKKELGYLDLGKGNDFFNYDPFLKFLKLTHYKGSLSKLESYLLSHENFHELELELEPTITSRITTILGKKEYVGFSSNEVCYGIGGYRLPIELIYIWNQIEKILGKFSIYVDNLIKLFREEILYYYRVSKRKNGDLFLVS